MNVLDGKCKVIKTELGWPEIGSFSLSIKKLNCFQDFERMLRVVSAKCRIHFDVFCFKIFNLLFFNDDENIVL